MRPVPDGDTHRDHAAGADLGGARHHRRRPRSCSACCPGLVLRFGDLPDLDRCLRRLTTIRAAIDAAGGAIRFDEFMRLALYGEHGFYSDVGRAGRRGDFITSPEVGPLFGAVVARFIDAEWDAPRSSPTDSRSSRPEPGRARSPGRSSRPRPPCATRCATSRSRCRPRNASCTRAGSSRSRRCRTRSIDRCHLRQRAARQPAVPPRRVRRRVA